MATLQSLSRLRGDSGQSWSDWRVYVWPLNVPLRSLNRSSGCGARILGVCDDGTEVSEEPLPHNACTAGETGCTRSPAWNSERKTGRSGCCSDAVVIVACDDAAAGVTGRASGKLDR